MSLLDDILKKDLYRRSSTDRNVPPQEEPLPSGLTPEQQAEVLQMDFDNVNNDFKRGIRFFPSSVMTNSFMANKAAASSPRRPKRNHRKIEYGDFYGAEVFAEGLEGEVTADDTFDTPRYEVNGTLSFSPYSSSFSVSDLRLVIFDSDKDTAASEANLGSYQVSSLPNAEEIKVASNTFDTSASGEKYKYAVVVFRPPRLLPVKSAGKKTTYLTVKPREWPVFNRDDRTGKIEFLASDSWDSNKLSFIEISDEQVRVRVDTGGGVFSVHELIELDGRIYKIERINTPVAGHEDLTLVPFRNFEIKGISSVNGPLHRLYKVNDLTSSPFKSPGDDHNRNHINALFNSKYLDWIRVRDIVPPRDLNQAEGTVGLFDTDIQSGMGLSLVPEDSGDPSLKDAIVNFSNVTVDPNSSNTQEIFVDWEEGLIRLSDPIPDSGGDLNPNDETNPNLYASWVSYDGPKNPQATTRLQHRSTAASMEIAPSEGPDVRKSKKEDHTPIEDTKGWVAHLADKTLSSKRHLYHNFPVSDVSQSFYDSANNAPQYNEDGGYDPAIGFNFDDQDVASEIRFQRRDLDDAVSGRWRKSKIQAGRTEEPGNGVLYNQIAFYPDVNDSGWSPNSGKGNSVRFVSPYQVNSDPRSNGEFTSVPDSATFKANINGQHVSFNYLSSNDDSNGSSSDPYINTSDSNRDIKNEIIPELRGKIESNSSLTAGEDFFVREEIAKNDPFVGDPRLVLEATDYLEILTPNDPYFSQEEGEIENTWQAFGRGGDFQDRMTYHDYGETLDWHGKDITVDGVGGLSGPAGMIEKGLFSMHLSGFDIKKTTSVSGGVEVDVKAGTYAATKHGPTDKTVRSIPETTNIKLDNDNEYYLVPDRRNNIVKALNRDDITGTSGGFPNLSVESEVPLWYFRIGSNDNVVEQEDLRSQFERFQTDQPIVVGDKNLHSMNMRQAIEIARYQNRFSVGLGKGQKIVMRGDATLTTDGSSPVVLPFGLTIEGNGNTLTIDSWNTDTNSVIRPEGRNEIRNVTFQINNANWEKTVNNHKEPVKAGALHSNASFSYSDVRLNNCKFETNPVTGGWIRKVTLSDDSSGFGGDFNIEITTSGGNKTFTVNDGTVSNTDPSTDDTNELADALASKIDGSSVGSGNFTAVHEGSGDIFIEEDSHNGVSYSISLSTTNDPDEELIDNTSNLLYTHNTLDVIKQEGGGNDTSVVDIENCSSDEGYIQIWNGTGRISVENVRLDNGRVEIKGSGNNTTDVHINQVQCSQLELISIDGNTFINQISVDENVLLQDCNQLKVHEMDVNEQGNASLVPLDVKSNSNMRGHLSSVHIPNSDSGMCMSMPSSIDDLTLSDCYFDASDAGDDCIRIGGQSTTISERIEIRGCRFERSSGSTEANGIWIDDNNVDSGVFVENCVFDEFNEQLDSNEHESRSIFILNDSKTEKHQAVNNSVRPSSATIIFRSDSGEDTPTVVNAGNIFY